MEASRVSEASGSVEGRSRLVVVASLAGPAFGSKRHLPASAVRLSIGPLRRPHPGSLVALLSQPRPAECRGQREAARDGREAGVLAPGGVAEATTPKLAAGMGRRLGVADLEADREAFLGGEPAGGLDQLRRQVDAADVGP